MNVRANETGESENNPEPAASILDAVVCVHFAGANLVDVLLRALDFAGWQIHVPHEVCEEVKGKDLKFPESADHLCIGRAVAPWPNLQGQRCAALHDQGAPAADSTNTLGLSKVLSSYECLTNAAPRSRLSPCPWRPLCRHRSGREARSSPCCRSLRGPP